jgi:carotenoid 1,2-hydratase
MGKPSHELIRLSAPGPELPETLLDVPGGFAWWYLDAVNDEGDGLVLIWSFGLPFLPGYRASGEAPRGWPSLSLAVYRSGRPAFYVLQQYAPEEASWQPEAERWTFGKTSIHRRREDGELRLVAEIDCEVPGIAHARGQVAVSGPLRVPSDGEPAPEAEPLHDWSVIAANPDVRAHLELDGAAFDFAGRGYHDRNGGRLPLWDLDCRRWCWGRVPRDDGGARIYYVLWPESAEAPTCLGLDVSADGRTTAAEVTVQTGGERGNLMGTRLPRSLRLESAGRPWLTIEREDRVDHGPFYTRCIVEASGPGIREQRGICEAVFPRRVDLARHRPLVRMKVHRTEGPNSLFLPLFVGGQWGGGA